MVLSTALTGHFLSLFLSVRLYVPIPLRLEEWSMTSQMIHVSLAVAMGDYVWSVAVERIDAEFPLHGISVYNIYIYIYIAIIIDIGLR